MATISTTLPVPARASLPTTRLELRPYRPADGEAFYTLLHHNRARLQPSFPARVAAVQTLDGARQVLSGFANDWQQGRLYVMGIWEQENGRYVGDISLKPTQNQPLTLEISYYLAAEAEGRGYAREALDAAVKFGFGLSPCVERLLIRCRANNPRSCAVATSAGFRQIPVRSRAWPLRPARATEILHFQLKREEIGEAAA